MDLLHRFICECKEYTLWSEQDKLVLAVSGGIDSMVLLDLMWQLPRHMRPGIILAHVNHQLRKESDAEEEELRKLAEEKGLPFYSATWSVSQHPDSGIEEAARIFRYTFFEEVMRQTNAAYLATAHHRSDQLETLLMRFVRGGQWERMTGIKRIRPFGNGQLIRPLLSFSKEELYDYAGEQGLLYFEDATNAELEYTRNRYRHTIIPLLKKENSAVEEHAEQFAQDMEDVLQLIQPLVEEAEASVRLGEAVSRSAFLTLEAPLRNMVLNRLLQRAYEGTEGTFKRSHVSQVVKWLKEGKPNSRLELPERLSIVRTYDQIQFVKEARTAASAGQEEEKTLCLGQWIELPNRLRLGLVASNELLAGPPAGRQSHIYLNPEEITLPLTIRNRRPGDRMTLRGMKHGTKKLKDIFIDQKVPLENRDEATVVTDAGGEILWLVNFKESSLSINPETDTIQYILICEHV